MLRIKFPLFCVVFILCIKHLDPIQYKKLTTKNQYHTINFWKNLEIYKKPYIIRYIIIPKINDDISDINMLCHMIKNCNYCIGIKLVAYNNISKYRRFMFDEKYDLDTRTPSQEYMKLITNHIKNFGIKVL